MLMFATAEAELEIDLPFVTVENQRAETADIDVGLLSDTHPKRSAQFVEKDPFSRSCEEVFSASRMRYAVLKKQGLSQDSSNATQRNRGASKAAKSLSCKAIASTRTSTATP